MLQPKAGEDENSAVLGSKCLGEGSMRPWRPMRLQAEPQLRGRARQRTGRGRALLGFMGRDEKRNLGGFGSTEETLHSPLACRVRAWIDESLIERVRRNQDNCAELGIWQG